MFKLKRKKLNHIFSLSTWTTVAIVSASLLSPLVGLAQNKTLRANSAQR